MTTRLIFAMRAAINTSGFFALMAVVAPAHAAEKPIFRASTETPTPGARLPSPPLAQAVVAAMDKDDVALLDDCLTENGLKRGQYASLLRAVRIQNQAGRTLWFVRPALEPFCMALYGAHAFRYFLFEELSGPSKPKYRIVFRNGGDAFAVYPRVNHGLNDIEPTGCIATGCRSARLSFDGNQYRPVQCSVTTWDGNGREIRRTRRCESDDGSDIQSSGFVKD